MPLLADWIGDLGLPSYSRPRGSYHDEVGFELTLRTRERLGRTKSGTRGQNEQARDSPGE